MLFRSMRTITAFLVALLLLSSCSTNPAAQSRTDDAERGFTVLAINDVYRVEGVAGGEAGGVGRVRTLRAELEADGEEVLLLHAGDALFPSLASRVFRGAQMIEVLNLLDGDPEAHDDDMFFVFGNHEFDEDGLEDAPALQAHIENSQFRWLGTNIVWEKDEEDRPLIRHDRLIDDAIVEIEGVRVGIFGLATDFKHPEYIERFDDPLETARRLCRELRQAGAEVVIALTHLRLSQDRALLDALGDAGPDLVIGGHEHHELEYVHPSGRRVVKAAADAVSATVVRVESSDDGWKIDHEWRRLGPEIEPDAAIAVRAEKILAETDRVLCSEMTPPQSPGCLAKKLAVAATDLIGDEMMIRTYETTYGNWIVDQAFEHFQGDRQGERRDVEIAFLNAGSMRLNRDLAVGEEITRQVVEETFLYANRLVLIEIDGATLRKVVERSVEEWGGGGHFLQIAGFAFQHDPETGEIAALTKLGEDGPRPIEPEETFLAVTSDFLINPEFGQDGYTMLRPSMIVERSEVLKDLIVEVLRTAPTQGVFAKVEGRICVVGDDGPCLATSP